MSTCRGAKKGPSNNAVIPEGFKITHCPPGTPFDVDKMMTNLWDAMMKREEVIRPEEREGVGQWLDKYGT